MLIKTLEREREREREREKKKIKGTRELHLNLVLRMKELVGETHSDYFSHEKLFNLDSAEG